MRSLSISMAWMPTAVDTAALAPLPTLAEQRERPVFQTEMQADGLETAILIHHALTAGGASAYLQNDLVSLTRDMAKVALVLLTDDGFEPQGPYYALSQYAKSTDPGWVRVDATSDSTELLGSAWLSPDESALSVVLVNPGTEELDAEIVLPDAVRSRLVRTAGHPHGLRRHGALRRPRRAACERHRARPRRVDPDRRAQGRVAAVYRVGQAP